MIKYFASAKTELSCDRLMIPHVHFLVNANVNAMEVRAYIDRIESFSCLDKKRICQTQCGESPVTFEHEIVEKWEK